MEGDLKNIRKKRFLVKYVFIKLRKQNIKEFFKNLQNFGYRYLKKKFKKKIIKNFQRRYRQNRVDGALDSETLKISEILSKKSNIA